MTQVNSGPQGQPGIQGSTGVCRGLHCQDIYAIDSVTLEKVEIPFFLWNLLEPQVRYYRIYSYGQMYIAGSDGSVVYHRGVNESDIPSKKRCFRRH